jgi:hypothetical protein
MKLIMERSGWDSSNKKSASALLNLADHWKTTEEAVAAAGGLK